MIFERLTSRLAGASPRDGSDPTADKLRRLLAATGVDPGTWGNDLSYALIASASNQQETQALLNAVGHHAWEEVQRLERWNAKGDNVMDYAILSSQNTGAVLVVKSLYELYGADELWRIENISREECTKIVNSNPLLEWGRLM